METINDKNSLVSNSPADDKENARAHGGREDENKHKHKMTRPIGDRISICLLWGSWSLFSRLPTPGSQTAIKKTTTLYSETF